MLRSRLSILLLFGTLSAAPAFAAPIAAQNHDDHAQRQQERRMYDDAHRDYHEWNGEEDRRYHEYMTAQHRKYKDFSRLSKKQQSEYWSWRHDHDDHR
jgi:hypothetical protein